MSTEQPFFTEPNNVSALNRLQGLLRGIRELAQPEFSNEVKEQLSEVLRYMIGSPKEFDNYTRHNQAWIGKRFFEQIRNFNPEEPDASEGVIDIFCMSFRFLCELEFMMPGELTFDLSAVKSFVDRNLSKFPARYAQSLAHALYSMPAAILRAILKRPGLNSFLEFDKTEERLNTLKATWDEELNIKQAAVDGLKLSLEKYETAFNFVGLVEAFRMLIRDKLSDKRRAFYALLGIGALTLVPLGAELWFLYSMKESLDNYKQILLFAAPAIAAVEILLIYYFRVVLAHFRSVKAQLLQLELRSALCQFIQSYSTYSAQIKKADASALEKFESLIFSGLLASEDALPSTFDGTEQLAKLIKSMKA